MKRYFALFACVFALTACGNQSDAQDGAAQSSAGTKGSDSANTDSGNGNANANNAGDFDSNDQKRSYALGMDIGNSLKELPVEIDVGALSSGIRDTVSGDQTRLTQKQLDGVMKGFVQDMEQAQQQKAQKQSKANAEAGKKFLAKNKKKDGVKTTDSGLQYKVIEQGDGPKPTEDDTVTVHYVGKLLDGTVFDSSRKRGKPVTFPVNAVIPGWTEALQLMKQGAEYKLFIPADLAYGERGAGAQIGPNQTLVFDVELIKVGKGDGKAGAGTSKSGATGTAGADAAGQGQAGQSQGDQGTGGQSQGAQSQGGRNGTDSQGNGQAKAPSTPESGNNSQ